MLLLLSLAPALRAQKPTFTTAAPAAPTSLEDRRKALNDVFHDYWEDQLKINPEFASSIGDLRYNDQISDYSVTAINSPIRRRSARICWSAISRKIRKPRSSKSGRCPSHRWMASTPNTRAWWPSSASTR
jgi:hypothetical protein